MAWVCLSEVDLDHILGEVEVEVKGDTRHVGDVAVEERTSNESLPQLVAGDILGLSGEAPT
ncbi:UNVERIFIED_CONTAM: hypothetical protein Slati_0455000 [Sesamum latifolium]|uniref:Uncharacterized protein n=1 Tax=Sesamum latifolium TaxID=2727402 RepID=A0AAW2XVY9_9LAMI